MAPLHQKIQNNNITMKITAILGAIFVGLAVALPPQLERPQPEMWGIRCKKTADCTGCFGGELSKHLAQLAKNGTYGAVCSECVWPRSEFCQWKYLRGKDLQAVLDEVRALHRDAHSK
ncbi:hypothetical protein O9K51_00891 [Purpureocillium lavendulum]|uniref:Uncharacterized protein n=1 Tax=Purpureocillium lavendulum TaxID=1247861 RepID=A0AB34G3V7_9HYPO|nr:hypothetical protein O9K51_00891 [Purpureocillium lavendulum]